MLQTKQKALRSFYYPVMPIESLESGPKSFVLMGQKIVLWLDEDKKPAAAIDRCCHRTSKLSGGWLREGCIVCPYHGWTFDRNGKCTWFPQSELEDPPKVYKIQSYRCKERYGYVWVALEDPHTDIPTFRYSDDPNFRKIDEFYEVIHCAGLRLMENSFDVAHVNFVHKDTFGEMESPIPPKVTITNKEWGFEAYMEIPVHNKLNGKINALNMTEEKTVRKQVSEWFMPFIRQTNITYPTGLIHSIVTCSTPIDDQTCQLVQFVFRNDTEADVPAANVIAFDRNVVDEDMEVLETTEYNVSIDLTKKLENHMLSDSPGILMRKMIKALLEKHGEEEANS